MGSSIFSAIRRLKFSSTNGASFSRMPSTDRTNGEKISVAHGNYYHDFPSFIFPVNKGVLPLAPYCMRHSLGNTVWHQLWPRYDFHISPRWGRHLLYPIWPSPDVPPPLICCSPVVLGVIYVHSEGVIIVVRSIWHCPSPHYDVR